MQDDTKKIFRKLALWYHCEKNKHPQASADFCMINEVTEGLEDLFSYNDAMMEQAENLQRQEEAWR